MSTAKNAVIANQMSVLTARRAAFVTCDRLEMEATTAVKISGTTAAFSRVTYEEPMVSKVTMSQLGLFFASPPNARASAPRTIPRMREAMIWLPKEVAHLGRRERDDACGVDMWHTLKLLRAPARVCVKKCFNPVQCRGCVTNRDHPVASFGCTSRSLTSNAAQPSCPTSNAASCPPHRRLNRLIVN